MIKSNIISQLKTSERMTSVILLLGSLVLFTECKRTTKDESFVGPEVTSASSDFYVINQADGHFTPYQYRPDIKTSTSLSTPTGSPKGSASFINDITTYFKATFSETVSWTIELSGLTSGAKKYMSGVSDGLTQENSTWDGGADDVYFFMENELVVARLKIQGSSVSYTDTIRTHNQNGAKPYKDVFRDGIYYILIDDFENASKSSRTLGAVSTDAFDKIDYFPSTRIKAQGLQSLYMSGTDVNWNGYMLAKATSEVKDLFNIKTTNPDSLYFNLYIYGTGTSNTTVSLRLFENEHYGMPYSTAANDAWLYDIIVDWNGWKLVSIPYSYFKKAPNPLSGGNGNGIREPNLVSGVDITLNSYPVAGKTIETYIDFATLTIGGPFKP